MAETDAAVPGLEEIKEIIVLGCGCDRDCEKHEDGACGCKSDAQRILDLFAPILAEKEREIERSELGRHRLGHAVREAERKAEDTRYWERRALAAEAERDKALLLVSEGAYADAHKNEPSIYQHALALTVERLKAAEAALAGERERVQQVLEPFDDALGEDDEGYGDGLTVVMKWGACTDYSVTLADLRDVRKLAAAIRAQGG